jgi:cysteinyl-tRNA synthetase
VVVHRRLADAAALRLGGDGQAGLLGRHAGELAGVEEDAVLGDGLVRRREYDVLYVQNITDVGHLVGDGDEGESKIEKRARERQVQPMQLAETYTREFFAAMDRLNCLRPDISPRATGHIPEMIALIERLIANGHAYVSEGNVYFDVESKQDYGKLSRRKLEDQESAGRIEPGAGKRNAADFALWKTAEGSGHLMNWPSPWGVGFPGWHIECSAMSMKYLGETFDIHGAGVDNIFPHNEDEVCQSEAATGKLFCRYWLHNGTVMVGGEKMSKSKGNFKTIADEIEKFGAQVLRLWVVASHYGSPIDYTEESVRAAARARERLGIALKNVERYLSLDLGEDDAEAAAALSDGLPRFRNRFYEAMDDDFNTPAALAVMFELATEMNRLTGAATGKSEAGTSAGSAARDLMIDLADVLGLVLTDDETASDNDITGALVVMLLEARQSLRKAKDFGAADGIRASLSELGIVVEDRPEGPTWRKATA